MKNTSRSGSETIRACSPPSRAVETYCNMDEEALIEAVLRLRAASAEPLSVAQLHAALVAEGADAEMGPVKKAASKAAKRAAAAGTAPEVPAAAAEASANPSNKELKAAKAAADSLKAAEGCMMKAQKRLQNRHMLSRSALESGEDLDKAAIERAVKRAISGALDPGETVSRERFEADLATLQWILHAGAPVDLDEAARKAATTQLEMLMAKKG